MSTARIAGSAVLVGKSPREKYAEPRRRPARARGPARSTSWSSCSRRRAPGRSGSLLRKQLYPWLLGSCGRNVVFGQNVVLRHPHKIHIGSNVVIDDNCLLDAKGESNRGIRIGDGVFIGRNSILSCKNGDIDLGAGANIGFNCEVFSASRVTIGAGVLMAAYSYVIGGDHDFSDPAKSVLDQTRTSPGVTIGDGAWMGAGAKVLDGVTIGEPRRHRRRRRGARGRAGPCRRRRRAGPGRLVRAHVMSA